MKWYRLSKPSFDAAPKRLGGPLPQPRNSPAAAAQAKDDLIAGSDVYENLSRKWPVSPISIEKNKNAPEFYKQFWEGECEVSWQHNEKDTEFMVSFRLPDEETLFDFHYRLCSKEEVQEIRRMQEEEGVTIHNKRNINEKKSGYRDEKTRAQLTEDQQDEIFRLLPLRFLSEHGAVFCDQHPKAFSQICNLEKDLNVTENHKKYTSLWGVLVADVTCTINNDDFLIQEGAWTRAHAFKSLGECIEAMKGRFEAAASLYELGASVAPYPILKGELHNCAALAYRRECLFDKAESHYLSAMRERILIEPSEENGGQPVALRDLNSPICTPVLKNTLLMYYHWRAQETGGGSLPSSSPAEPWFCVLLGRNGYQSNPMSLTGRMVDFYTNKITLKKLNSQKAQQCLIQALQCNNVADYHAKLLELRAMGSKYKSSSAKPPLLPIDPRTQENTTRQDHKESARAHFRGDEHGGNARAKDMCSFPSCTEIGDRNNDEGKKFKACPCGSVWYCSVDCQKEHWKAVHRHHCTDRKAKKNKKEKKK